MLVSYSVHKLNRICKKREIWCWGCGKRLHEIIELYEDEPFTECISTLVDKNPHLWDMVIRVKGRDIPVQPYDRIKDRWNRDVIIMITSDSCQEIYDAILKESGNPNILCCQYPQNYFSYITHIQALFHRLPLKRQILFSAGSEPHENALAVIDYLEHEYRGKPYHVVFLGDTIKKLQFTHVKVTYLDSDTLRRKNGLFYVLRFCWLYSVSAALLYENQPLQKHNRKQILIFLNHGTVPMKDVHDVLKQPETVDYALCPSQGCSGLYMEQYGIPAEKLIYAMPPRDSFLAKGGNGLKRIIGNDDRQIILWLPTFRTLKESERKDSAVEDALSLISTEENLEALNKRLRDNRQLLLIKCHPREKRSVDIPRFYDCICILLDGELAETGLVLQEIMGDTAALLTDYSGIAFEYLLLDKPIGYVVNDMDSYTRGFAFENLRDYMPGSMIGTVEELLEFLDDVRAGSDSFHEARKKLVAELFQGNEAKDGSRELLNELDCLNLCGGRKSGF